MLYIVGAYSQKTCLANGTWSISMETDLEQTEYEQCIVNTERKVGIVMFITFICDEQTMIYLQRVGFCIKCKCGIDKIYENKV